MCSDDSNTTATRTRRRRPLSRHRRRRTNNARLATQQRQLSSYYYKDPLIFSAIAQGLGHLGKGLLTLSPSHLTGRCTPTLHRWP